MSELDQSFDCRTPPSNISLKAARMTDITPGTASRLAAARVLDAVLHRGRSLKGEFGTELPKIADPRDRALARADRGRPDL